MRIRSKWSLRARLAVELGTLAAFSAIYLLVFTDRPRWLDGVLGVIAVTAIALDAARSRRLWAAVAAPRTKRSAGIEMVLFTGCAVMALAFAGAVIASPEGFAVRAGNWHLSIAILLYLPWAWLQQLVFQFYLLGRLLHLLPVTAAVGLTAIAFAAVHVPRYPVMAVTAVAGAFWALSYWRHRKLLPLAASHAVLGPVLHYWVLGRDLLADWLP